MPIVDVLVPQMGEGLQEVLVVELLKKSGDRVRRDEPFYSMETDKATLEVESPEEGVLVEWLAQEGDTLPIGAPICRIETSAPQPPGLGEPESPFPSEERTSGRGGGGEVRAISPRVRAYAREKGVSDTDLVRIPAASGKLMPEDVDAFLALDKPTASGDFVERALSAQDKTLLFRLKRSTEKVIPAVAKRQIAWEGIRALADRFKSEGGEGAPSAFNCVSYAIARAVAGNPKFRSTLIREEVVREYPHINLGIAVAMVTGEMTVAQVPSADALPFRGFVALSKTRISLARSGNDQADETTSLVLTYLGHYEIIDAIPVLVAPAAGVLFIGSPFRQEGALVANVVLTFDHRFIHGIEAAKFLKTIADNVAQIEEIVS